MWLRVILKMVIFSFISLILQLPGLCLLLTTCFSSCTKTKQLMANDFVLHFSFDCQTAIIEFSPSIYIQRNSSSYILNTRALVYTYHNITSCPWIYIVYFVLYVGTWTICMSTHIWLKYRSSVPSLLCSLLSLSLSCWLLYLSLIHPHPFTVPLIPGMWIV